MTKRSLLLLYISTWLFVFTAGCAFAQQADPDFLQKALAAMQSQRNQAMDGAAVLDAKLAKAQEDLAKAQARIKELEPKKASAK